MSSLFITFLGLLLASLTLPASSLKRPNVILIVTDDQGYGDMSCHGNPWLKTPNLDRLKAEGVSLSDYHVDPYCTPSRGALMTGRYCTRNGAWTVIHGRQLLGAEETIMPEFFAEAGYRTAMFGKWHLGDPYPYAPRFRGFQHVLRHMAGGVDEIGNPFENSYFNDTYFRNGQPEKFEGYCTDIFFREAIDFITTKSEDPFFIYLPTNAMHSPFRAPDSYKKRFLEMGHPADRANFFGMIENFDDNLGRLLAALKKQGLDENTLVIFMGDNGSAIGSDGIPDSGVGFNAGMRGKKGSVFDGGHRVACFARWPSTLSPGKQIPQLTTHRDWLPTLIELCDLNPQKLPQFDGRSMASLLRDADTQWPERQLIIEQQKSFLTKAPLNGKQPYAVLSEHWRLVNGKLYDIRNDPAQSHNLASDHPAIVQKLYSAYERHFEDIKRPDDSFSRFLLGGNKQNPTKFTARDWFPTEGRVFWSNSQINDDNLFTNGYWPIEILQDGTYQITLRRFPEDHEHPIGAKSARLEIGDLKVSQPLNPADTLASFNVQLKSGPSTLKTWFQDAKTNKTRGAYLVQIRLLQASKKES